MRGNVLHIRRPTSKNIKEELTAKWIDKTFMIHYNIQLCRWIKIHENEVNNVTRDFWQWMIKHRDWVCLQKKWSNIKMVKGKDSLTLETCHSWVEMLKNKEIRKIMRQDKCFRLGNHREFWLSCESQVRLWKMLTMKLKIVPL